MGPNKVTDAYLVLATESGANAIMRKPFRRQQLIDTVRRFRAHDQETFARQLAVKDDDKKLIATSRESAEQLLHLFEADTDQAGPLPDARSAAAR